MAVPTSDASSGLLPSIGSRLERLWFADIAIALFMMAVGARILTLEPYGLGLQSWAGGAVLGVSAFAFGVSFAIAHRLDEEAR